eukprot:CAMPEP_0172530000 /NCGR_PEP_ID=MMETSP1067-20121228/3892_1 /TAXON_ID=265564 ORGANISM="Thalassiosira punctigera, Strain Tpunct2005C2" /NCGR_SAMPLE_ID=MMETSP1067 /ASSEMBLY_ACC=CAM_ASM_000444 /LENGTH=557 /DNA_ID=CAMNT_0013314141 /DNA_START=89 /DNA_END=1762 /DNA_ORIENTATION=+
MIIIKRFLPLAAALLMGGVNAYVNVKTAQPDAPSASGLRNVLANDKYEPSNLSDVDAEFADFDEMNEVGSGRRLQSGSTTETTRCNTWCKLKQSLGLTVFGLLLVCLSPCVMWKNEGRHVNELRRIDFCKNKAVVVNNPDMPSDENTGQLIHFVGKVSVDEDALDLHPGPLNITTPLPKALVIKRTCMIYQKFEQASQQVKNDVIGAGQTTTTTFTVREDWTPMGPQAEKLEHLPEETNSRGIWDELVSNSGTPESAAPSPSNLPPELAALMEQADMTKAPHGIAISKAAHVGGFGISTDVVMSEQAVFQSEWMPLPAELVPDDIEPLPELRKDRYGNLTTVEEGDQPTNGDVMIKYEYAADGFDASFIVQQVLAESDPEKGVPVHKFGVDKGRVLDEKCCGKISDDLGLIWMVRRGRHDLHEMIKMAQKDEAMVTKVLRILCWALLVAGWMMLFSIFTTLLNTLPIIGTLGSAAFFVVALIVGTVCCCGVTATAYVRYRPLLAFGIIALASAIAGIIIWRLDYANSTTAQPTPVPVPKSPTFIYADYTDVTGESIY